jgi:hypothetical protein
MCIYVCYTYFNTLMHLQLTSNEGMPFAGGLTTINTTYPTDGRVSCKRVLKVPAVYLLCVTLLVEQAAQHKRAGNMLSEMPVARIVYVAHVPVHTMHFIQ